MAYDDLQAKAEALLFEPLDKITELATKVFPGCRVYIREKDVLIRMQDGRTISIQPTVLK